MKKQLLFVVGALVAILLAAGQLARAAAGPELDDPQDALPAWSPNGADIAFQRTVPNLTPVVFDMSAGGKSVHGVSGGRFRGWVPDTKRIVVGVDEIHTLVLEDTGRNFLPRGGVLGTDATASPDGTRLAYLRDGSLYSAATDGSGERALAAGVTPSGGDVAGPVWSPDGTRIVIAAGGSLLLVQANGSGSRALTTAAVNPSWSADGSTIAFERNAQVWLIRPDGTGERDEANGRLPAFSPVDPTLLAYISDRQHVPGGATPYQYALYVQPTSSFPRKLVDDVHPGSRPAWSPSGAQIAVSAGRECRRWGIYVVAATGGSAHRRSNICRFDGTASGETIRGSQYFDLVNGEGGDDTIYGLGGNDKISGENGNDVIDGGNGNDFVLAGPGNDRIYGGSGNDIIAPGNGHDVVDCGLGNDTVEGAGPLDRISKNCEHVRR